MFKKAALYLSIALVLTVIGYLARLNHNNFERAMIDQALRQLLIIARSEAQSMEGYIEEDVHQELEILASSSTMQNIAKDKNNKTYYNSLQDSYKDIKNLVDAIYLLDSGGLVLSTSPFHEGVIGENFSDKPEVKIILENHRPYISGVFKTSSGERAIADLYPVFKEGEFIGLLRAVILVDRINNLAGHINRLGSDYALVIDNKSTILSYPDAGYIGKNIASLSEESFPDINLSELKALAKRINNAGSGTDVLQFLPGRNSRKVVRKLVAYSPIRIGDNVWSIAIVMDYNTIAGPVNRNARDNLIFTGFVLMVFIILGYILRKKQKEKDKLEISTQALNIINKQLHLEIDERKQLQDTLKGYLSNRDKP